MSAIGRMFTAGLIAGLTAVLATLCSVAALAQPALPPAADGARRIAVPWLACDEGAYAFALARHLPTLRNIGHHRIVDAAGGLRRMEYIGMDLDIEPLGGDRFRLLEAESRSRRWNIGALSVGRQPWRWPWNREKELEGVALDGWLELVGPRDSVLLALRDGRVDRVRYRCAPR